MASVNGVIVMADGPSVSEGAPPFHNPTAEGKCTPGFFSGTKSCMLYIDQVPYYTSRMNQNWSSSPGRLVK